MKKIISILLCLVLMFSFSGCDESENETTEKTSSDISSNEEILPDQDNNPYSTHKIVDGETVVEYDYSKAYNKLNLSQYTDHGEFSDDGIMWVKKSDYTGTQYGYIDYNGNFIIPLTSEINKPGEFMSGFASVVYAIDDGLLDTFNCNFVNTKGEILFTYTVREDYYQYIYHKSKEIILFKGIHANGIGGLNVGCVYFAKTNKLVEFSGGDTYTDYFSFSDGLFRTIGKKNSKWYCEFYNENGEIELKIDENSNEYYTEIYYVDNFVNGKSTVTFVGKDESVYKVTIDKKGNWLDEPTLAPHATDF